uniref:Uncharacterized protein n=1 Tax=Caenorhabditis japonica TaxID=281687 RepID=A0A8R1ERP7_CAEJA
MIKQFIFVLLVLVCHVISNITEDGQQKLQIIDVSPQDDSQQNVKEIFANAFKSIQVQREKAAAAVEVVPVD